MEKQFDSYEERYMDCYLSELKERRIIYDYEYHPDSFDLSDAHHCTVVEQLKTKSKQYPVLFLNQHKYTADFRIVWNVDYFEKIFREVTITQKQHKKLPFLATYDTQGGEWVTYIDAKGAFPGRNNSSAVTFPLNQKWTYDKYRVFVQKIVPVKSKGSGVYKKYSGLFPETFTPQRYLKTDGGGMKRKINFEVKLIDTYLKELI